MAFSAIVTDFALREDLGYRILDNKVFWDCQGKLKKQVLTSNKVVQKSPSRVHSKKTWAYKIITQSDKPTTNKASASKTSASKSSTRLQAKGDAPSIFVVEAPQEKPLRRQGPRGLKSFKAQ